MGIFQPLVSRRMVRRVGIAVAGFSVILVGVAMIVLPGPAVIIIPLGLTILSKEFAWAGRLMSWLRISRRLNAARRLVGRPWVLARILVRNFARTLARSLARAELGSTSWAGHVQAANQPGSGTR